MEFVFLFLKIQRIDNVMRIIPVYKMLKFVKSECVKI